MREKIGWGLGTLMLTERVWKYRAVTRFFQQPQFPKTTEAVKMVSILQAILSGDPTLPHCLETNLHLKSQSKLEFVWLVDESDQEGQRICQELMERYPARKIQLVLLPPTQPDCSPKTFKLIAGSKVAHGDVICVLDDDTMLPEDAMASCLPFLEQAGVGLAFGLPYYVNFSNIWSSMVSTYVNSNSLLTYIPYTTLADPFTINGMFYVMRREVLARIGGFEAIRHIFADDFAIANLCRKNGYKLIQTTVCHGISTQVKDARHYFSLLQRWFVFPRESILRHVSLRELVIFYTVVMLPALFPLWLVVSLLLRPSWQKMMYTLLYFGWNGAMLGRLNARYLHYAQPRDKAWLVPVMMVLVPVQIIVSLCLPQKTNWRGHIVQVEHGGGFRYLKRRV